MGLKGQLEDLPLIDMLQIVAFSRKSGYLKISAPAGRGAVVLEEGRVMFAYSWSTAEAFQEMVQSPAHVTVELVRSHVETSLRELARTTEGSFQFELAESIGDVLEGVNIRSLILPGGLDPQELLLDLAVEIDTGNKDAEALLELAYEDDPLADDETGKAEAPAAGPARELPPISEAVELVRAESRRPPSSASVPGEAGQLTVVLVDDEKPVTDVVGRELARLGFRVATASRPAAGARAARKHASSEGHVFVVVDLKMPTSSERSFYGGFELVRRLKKRELELPVLLMVENLTDKVKARAKELGVRALLHKPFLTKLDPDLYRADLVEFAGAIAARIRKLAEDDAKEATGRSAGAAANGEAATGDFIAGMTRKLLGSKGSVDVSRLVLEAAEHFLERGVLLVVQGDAARGLAGFGLGTDDSSDAASARRVSIDVNTCAPLQEVVRDRSAHRVHGDLAPLTAPLFSHIGRGRAQEAVLIPLLYDRETLLLVYGDNGVSGRALPQLSELELFVAQAGVALENKLLQRKLDASGASGSADREATLGSSG